MATELPIFVKTDIVSGIPIKLLLVGSLYSPHGFVRQDMHTPSFIPFKKFIVSFTEDI